MDEHQQQETTKLKQLASDLKLELCNLRQSAYDKTINKVVQESNISQLAIPQPKCRRILRGHLAKVLRIQWLNNSELLSISPDGRVLFWDTTTGMKKMLKQLPNLWSTCCACSKDRNLLITGGLDNICVLRSLKNMKQSIVFKGHTAFISHCTFLSNDERILTSSGDATMILWDVSTSKPIHKFIGHESDVLDFCLSKDERIIVSASVDKSCMIWDLRGRQCKTICEGHEKDVNSVCFFPTENAFVSGSDDQTCRLFDIRSDQFISIYSTENRSTFKSAGVTSVAFSKSGRAIIAGYEDMKCRIWDTLMQPCKEIAVLNHPNRVSVVAVNPSGDAISTACWDCNIRIWN